MSTLDNVWVFHAEPSCQHTAIGATKGENRAVLVLRVGLLDSLDEAGIVHQGLINSEVFNIILSEGLISKW